jgi:hypothetical protein
MAEEHMAAPAGTRWTAPVDRETQVTARIDAVALEHMRTVQDRPETAASALPPSLQPATGRPSPTGGSTTWSQAVKRPFDAKRQARLRRDSEGTQ